jgi:hypothetical protein
VIILLYRTLRFSHVEMFPSTAGGTIGQRDSSVSSVRQRCFVIIRGNVLDKTSALFSSYIVILHVAGHGKYKIS